MKGWIFTLAIAQTCAAAEPALIQAAYDDDSVETARLLDSGADPNAKNRYGVFSLSLACQNGNAEIVQQLLAAGANPNSELRGGETVLMTAARTGKTEPIAALLKAGAKVNATEHKGQTALMWAAAEGHADAVRLLLDAGSNPDTTLKNSGFNAWFFAARNGRIEVIEALLKNGADVQTVIQPGAPGGRKPRMGMSALLLAVENGHFELADQLLQAGADANDMRSGVTALHALIGVRKPARGDNLEGAPSPIGSGDLSSLELVQRLVAHGADVNLQLRSGKFNRLSLNGATPMLMAAKTADVPLMRLLVELGADPHLPNDDNTTPLLAAAGYGCHAPGEEAGTEAECLEALKFLIELGGDVNHVDQKFETALHGAAYKSLPEVVRFLAANGADQKIWNRKNRFGWTPLRIAQGYRPGNFKPSQETIAAFAEVMR
ncbi:MAG: ankyrin repeat protein [Verrucomicrobiales bacterium]|jgi:ankyrin repeat protein